MSPGLTPPTVLVVDDEPSIRRLATRSLASQGYRVLEAAGGGEAFRRAETEPRIDLVVLDLSLPDLAANDVLAGLEARSRIGSLLLISGWTEPPAIPCGPGRRAFLQKPFSHADLVAAAQALLE